MPLSSLIVMIPIPGFLGALRTRSVCYRDLGILKNQRLSKLLISFVPYVIQFTDMSHNVIQETLFHWSFPIRENLQPLLPCCNRDHYILTHSTHIEFLLYFGLIRAQILPHHDIIPFQFSQVLDPFLLHFLQLLQLLTSLGNLLFSPLFDLAGVY